MAWQKENKKEQKKQKRTKQPNYTDPHSKSWYNNKNLKQSLNEVRQTITINSLLDNEYSWLINNKVLITIIKATVRMQGNEMVRS